MGTGYPGYNSLMSKSCGTVDGNSSSRNGWNTSWYGKNHNVPDWQSSQAGPFDLWPTGLGFEHFYGFIGGDTDQWHPALFDGTNPLDWKGAPNRSSRSTTWTRTWATMPWPGFASNIRSHRLIRSSPTTPPEPSPHAPHHAPKEWIAKFKGQFDQGWDKVREETLARQIKLGVVPEGTKLTPRPKDKIPAWDSLDANQKEPFAHMAEIYAAFLAYDDYNIGRVIDSLKQEGLTDNTLVIFIEGDNGGSAEEPCRERPTRSASSAMARKRASTTSIRSRTSWAARCTTTTCRCHGPGRSIRRSSGPSAMRAISAARATAWS